MEEEVSVKEASDSLGSSITGVERPWIEVAGLTGRGVT